MPPKIIFKIVLLFSVFLLGLFNNSQGQMDNYIPISDYTISEDTIAQILKKVKLPAYSHNLEKKKAITKFENICLERSNYVKGLNEEQLLMTGDTITNWVNKVLDRLVDANPILQDSEYRVYTHRSSICNAYNIGEGVILINLGLLMSIDSEEELAFVIAHEIGHDILKHVMKSTASQCILYSDKEFLKSLKKASKQEYGANSEIERIILTVMSNEMLHSRKNEYFADSLGFELYNNAGYLTDGALDLLEVLDSSDYFLSNHDIELRKALKVEGYALKDEWFLNKDLNPMWGQMENLYKIPDSLKTHPGCQDRMESIKRIASIKNEDNRLRSTSYFEIESVIKFELLQILVEEGRAVEAMYYAIKYLQENPDNTYLHCIIANSLLEVHDALQNMQFRWYVPFPDAKYPIGYNKALSFFHNMSSSKLKSMFDVYITYHIESRESDVFVDYLKFRNSHLNDEVSSDNIIEYGNKIENTYFKNKIENLKVN